MQHQNLHVPQPQGRQSLKSAGSTMNSNTTSTYFAPINSLSDMRMRESEHGVRLQQELAEDERGAERLTTLHSRLHQEADKIRRWKLQTETELQQKERKIQDSTQTIDSLRKSMLNQQLQNENLSLKLQEEITNKDEIMEKIKATRNMCNVLKGYAEKLEDRMQKCETEKTELKYLEKQHMTQFEELSAQFKQLEITATENTNKLSEALKTKQDEHHALQADYSVKLEAAKAELAALVEQGVVKDRQIQEINTQLQANIQELNNITQMRNELQGRLAETEVALERQRAERTSVQQELTSMQTQMASLESQLDEATSRLHETMVNKDKLAKNFDETEKLYVNKIKSTQDELEVLQDSLEKSKQKVEELQTKLTQANNAVEDLKCAKDMLTLERTEASNKIQKLESTQEGLYEKLQTTEDELEKTARSLLDEKDDAMEAKNAFKILQCEHQQAKKEMGKKKTEVDTVKENLIQVSKELALKEDELERSGQELKEALEREKDLHNKLDDLKSDLENESGENQTIAQGLQEMKKDKQSLQKEVTASKKEITKLKKDLQKSSNNETRSKSELEDALSKFEAEKDRVAELEQQLAEQVEATSQLQEENNKLQSLEGDLSCESKRATDMEQQMKSIKGDVTAKNKHIKELEKEVKVLKGKLTTQTKTSTSLEQEGKGLQEQLEAAAQAEEKLRQDIADLKKEQEAKDEAAQEQAKKLKELQAEVQKAVTEKEANTKSCDYKMDEMMALLEQHSLTNDKIITDKNVELEEVKAETARLKKQERDIGFHTRQLDQSKQKNVELETEIADKSKALQDCQDQISQLQEEAKQRAEKISELETAVENAKKTAQPVRPPVMPCTPQLHQPQPAMSTPIQTASALTVTKTPRCETLDEPVRKLETPRQPLTSSRSTLPSAFKKRRVMFSGEGDGASEPPSSPELMDVEVDELEKRLKLAATPTGKAVTPSRSLLTPRVRASPLTKTGDFQRPRCPALKPVPRGPPVSKIQAKRKSQGSNEDELTQFKNLYPEAENDASLVNQGGKTKKAPPAKAPAKALASNVRMAPAKPVPKFFLSSPRERKKKVKKQGAQGAAWYDDDPIFGLGPED